MDGRWTKRGLYPINTPTEAQRKAQYEFGLTSKIAESYGVNANAVQTLRAKIRQAVRESGIPKEAVRKVIYMLAQQDLLKG